MGSIAALPAPSGAAHGHPDESGLRLKMALALACLFI